MKDAISDTQSSEETPASEKRVTTQSVIAWVLVVVWALVIFFASSTTGNQIDTGKGFLPNIYHNLRLLQADIFGPDIDALSPFLHFMEYFVFGVLLHYALSQHLSLKRAFIITIVIASAYGITDEIHQYFVPGRDCNPLDWFIDMLGASFGSLIVFFVKGR